MSKQTDKPVCMHLLNLCLDVILISAMLASTAACATPVLQPTPTGTTQVAVDAQTDTPPTQVPAPSATPAPTRTAAPTPTATPEPLVPPKQENSLVLALSKDIVIELVQVPAGEFLMGSVDNDPAAQKDEKPQHTVYLDEYLIGKTEVTVAQYRLFVQATGYPADPRALTSQDNWPVSFVTYDDAIAFAAWLSEWTGRQVTLPTEAQWEKAARGTDGRLYPWGDQPVDCTLANYFKPGGFCTSESEYEYAPVGSYPAGASPYGALDMVGNVWEWVSDYYQADYYQKSVLENPTGPEKGVYRMVRGGAWEQPPYGRISRRSAKLSSKVDDPVGFRIAVALPVKPE